MGCHPTTDQWESTVSTPPEEIERWWASTSCSVLLATGHHFDVIEVPEWLGAAAVHAHTGGPVAVTPAGRWMFLVTPGERLRPDLTTWPGLVLHQAGSWIPAPPTRTPQGRVTWAVHPAVTGWQVSHAQTVQQALTAAPHPSGRGLTFASTTRGLRHIA